MALFLRTIIASSTATTLVRRLFTIHRAGTPAARIGVLLVASVRSFVR